MTCPSKLSAAAGFVFAGMAVVSFLVILPASRVSDRLGRKWTIVPSAVAMASALLLMAAAGASRQL
jgi:MFS family permease